MIEYSLFGTAGHQLHPELTRLPITVFRWGWGTLVLIRRAQIPSGMISFASDISQDIFPIAGVSPCGSATYESGSFGWLQGTRKGRLYKLSPWTQEEISANVADIFCKRPYTYPCQEEFRRISNLLNLSPEDCLFYENGEKEYSCEITKVYDTTAELLLRYTVNGNNAGDGIESIYRFQRV